MKYKCQKCSFIHDGEMPDGYICPLCQSGLFDFKLISEEEKIYNRIKLGIDNPSLDRINDNCINCGACTNTCINKVGAKKSEDNDTCLYCGGCILTCPKGALTTKYDYQTVWELINIPNKKVICMTAPAVRVSLGDAFGYAPGEFLEKKMVSSLKALGFDYVFDVSFGADLTSVEEASELKMRIDNNKNLPMLSSCCPSWVKYADVYHSDLKKNLSTALSPIGMQSSIIKEIFAKEENINLDDLIIVAITPCTSKKYEALTTEVDYVLTTAELGFMIREQGINFKSLEDVEFDSLLGSSSGIMFGTSGGVALSVLRTYYFLETGDNLSDYLLRISDKDFYKEYSVKVNNKKIKCAVVAGMHNLEKLIPILNEFVFIEVMNCPLGCAGGGGQIVMPIKDLPDILNKRKKSLISVDKKPKIKYPYDNHAVSQLYDEYLDHPLSEESKKLLHHKGGDSDG